MLIFGGVLCWPALRTRISRRRLLLGVAPLAWLAALTLVHVATTLGVRLNTSPSVPLGFYRLTSASAARGDIVAACPPASAIFEMARERGYLWRGTCPGDFVPLLKVVAATPGDEVTIDEQGVRINGMLWPSSAPRVRDGAGRSLPPPAHLSRPLARNEVLLMSRDLGVGFDARYFGAVPTASLLASAKPLLTW